MPPILINRAPFNALVDDSGNNLDGSIWNKAAIKSVLLDPIDVALADADDGTTKDAAQDTIINANAATIVTHTNQLALINTGAWTLYTPTWISDTGTQPAIGNGQLNGRYQRIGKTINFYFQLVWGTTTTGGTGSFWIFSLPFAPLLVPYCFPSMILNSGGGALGPCTTAGWGSDKIYIVNGAGQVINQNVPAGNWSGSAQIHVRGQFELP